MKKNLSVLMAAALVLPLATFGCGTRGDNLGALDVALVVGPGITLDTVGYAISGPASFSRSGTIDVSASGTISAVIGGIPAGMGYTIALTATTSDGGSCAGASPFDVTAGTTSAVNVHITCQEPPVTGSISLTGHLNLCPVADAITANPAEVVVGGTIALGGPAHDVDQGPSPLSFHWTTTGGTLSDASAQNPVLTCAAPGPVTLTLTVSDGDPAPGCAPVVSATVTCSALAADGGIVVGTGGTIGAAGASGTGGIIGAAGSAGTAGVNGAAGSNGAAGARGAAGANGAAGTNGAAGANGAAGTNGAAGAVGTGGAGTGATGAGGAIATGDVVIYRIGDGLSSLANTGNPVFVDEYTPAGALVRTTAMPIAPNGANHRLVASGTATSEGLITRSTDGKFVLLTGYDIAIPAASSIVSSSGTTNPRVIGRLDASGTVDTTTALTDAATGSNPRSAASPDGVSFWFTGAAGGIRFASLGGATSVQLSTTVTNLRQVNIFGGQVYVTDASGSAVRLGAVGTGLPTTAGQPMTNIPGFATSTGSPYGFFFADLDPATPGLDTLYVADDSIGLTKYSLVGGTWTANGTVGTGADAYRSVVGVVSGSRVALFAVRGGGSTATGGGELVSLTDGSGFNGAFAASPTSLAVAPTMVAFRGVALAPQP